MGGRFSSWQDNFREKIRLGEEEGGMASAQKVFFGRTKWNSRGEMRNNDIPPATVERAARKGWGGEKFVYGASRSTKSCWVGKD